jgi:hypothetical protein
MPSGVVPLAVNAPDITAIPQAPSAEAPIQNDSTHHHISQDMYVQAPDVQPEVASAPPAVSADDLERFLMESDCTHDARFNAVLTSEDYASHGRSQHPEVNGVAQEIGATSYQSAEGDIGDEDTHEVDEVDDIGANMDGFEEELNAYVAAISAAEHERFAEELAISIVPPQNSSERVRSLTHEEAERLASAMDFQIFPTQTSGCCSL